MADDILDMVGRGANLSPTITDQEPVEQDEFNPGFPAEAPEGAGAQFFRDLEEDNKTSLQQTFRDQIEQSAANSIIEWSVDQPEALMQLWSKGTESLEPKREELTQDIPLSLHGDIMNSFTEAGARAKRNRILEDEKQAARLSAQTGLSASAVKMGGSLLDLDLPLMFATGGTLAGARTAAVAARRTKALTGATSLARTAGDAAVGVTGGAFAGAITGGAEALVRPDRNAFTMYERILTYAATGGVLNPVIGRALPDRSLWGKAAYEELSSAMRNAERDFNKQIQNPESGLYNNSKPIEDFEFTERTARQDRAEPFTVPIENDGSLSAAASGGGRKSIDIDAEIAKLRKNKTKAGKKAPEDVHPDVQKLADAGASEGAIRRSYESQQILNRTGFDDLIEEDLSNGVVRFLTGNSSFEVNIPMSKLAPVSNRVNSSLQNWNVPLRIPNTDKTIDLGQIAGTAFTLGHRDFTRMARSNSVSARFVASEILESASGLGRSGTTAAMNKEFYFASAMTHVMEPMLEARQRYFRENGLNPALTSSQEKFARDMRLMLDEYSQTGKYPVEYERFVKGNDEANKRLLAHMRGESEELSVRGARDIEEGQGYFNYAWSGNKFLEAIRLAGKNNVVRAMAKGYRNRLGLDKDIALKIAKAMVRRFEDRGLGRSTADSGVINVDTRSSVERVLRDANVPEPEIKSIMQRMDANAKERATKGFLKSRNEIDLKVKIKGTNMQLVDLMEGDLERTIQSYGHEAAGAAALASKGLRDQADVQTLRETIVAELAADGADDFNMDFLDAVFSQFGGTSHKGIDPITGKQTTGVTGLTSMFTSATRISLLQRLGLTSLMDTANIFVANGLANSMEPAMARLGFDRVGKLSKAELTTIQDSLESMGVIAGQDHIIFRSHLAIDETSAGTAGALQGLMSGVRTIEKATYYASGHNHVLAAQQKAAVAASYINAIRSISGDGGTLSPRMLRDMGLTPETISEMKIMIDAGQISVKPGSVTKDFGELSEKAQNEFISGLYRSMSQQVQRPVTGETSVWMNSDIGKLLTTLKSFAFTATQKQTARNLMVGGRPHFMAAAAWQLGFSYAVLSASQAIQGQEMSAIDRARLAVSYAPTLGTFPLVTDPMTTMLGLDDLNFSPYGRYTSYLDTPVFETAQKLSKAPGGLAAMLSGEGDYDDMQNARAMAFMNWYGMKQVWESMRD